MRVTKKMNRIVLQGGGEGALDDFKRDVDAYGVGVRAGALTPQPEDEKHFRKKADFPVMSEKVEDAWTSDGGVRRPVTLQSGVAFDATQDQIKDESQESSASEK